MRYCSRLTLLTLSSKVPFILQMFILSPRRIVKKGLAKCCCLFNISARLAAAVIRRWVLSLAGKINANMLPIQSVNFNGRKTAKFGLDSRQQSPLNRTHF